MAPIKSATGVGVVAASAVTLLTMGRASIVLVAALVVSYVIWLSRDVWPRAEHVLPFYAAAFLVQCAHIVEEYRGDFNRVFPPVLGSEPWSDRRFLAFNMVWLVVFALAGAALARRQPWAVVVALFLALGAGVGNGLGHLALSARAGGYFPGAYTGALALVVGGILAYRLLQRPASV